MANEDVRATPSAHQAHNTATLHTAEAKPAAKTAATASGKPTGKVTGATRQVTAEQTTRVPATKVGKTAPPEAKPAEGQARAGKARRGAKQVAVAGLSASGEVVGADAAGGPAKGNRVKLNLSYVSPLSVAKISFLISIALGIAFVVAVFLLWEALNDRAVFTQLDQMIGEVVGANRPDSLNVTRFFEQGRVMSAAAIIAVVDVVALTLFSTLGAVIYNLIAALVGGVRVTLREH
jgi:hypothetical protein